MFTLEGSLKGIISALGLALVICSIPISMYVKVFFGFMNLNTYLILLGLVLLFPYRNVGNKSLSQMMIFCIMFSVIAIIYMYLGNYEDSMHYVYNTLVIIIGLSLGLSWYETDFKIGDAIKIIWIISAFCSIITLYVLQTGMFGMYAIDNSAARNENDVLIFDLLTAAGCCRTNLLASLYILSKEALKKKTLLLIILFIILDFYLVLFTQKRTPLIVAVFILFFFILKGGISLSSENKNIIRYFVAAAFVGVILLFMSNTTSEYIANMIDGIYYGVYDMINGTDSTEAANSATIRYMARQDAWSTISGFSLFEYVFGKGYMTQWIDAPILQSYLDMGIMGLVFFGFFILYLPFKVLFLEKYHTPELLWAALNASYGMIACFNSGHPYGHARWIPICILIYVYLGAKEEIDNNYILEGTNES